MRTSTRESITTDRGAVSLASRPRSPAGDVVRRFVRNRLAIAGLFIVVLLCVTALAAPIIAPRDPAESTLGATRATPSSEYVLGADELGRDILSRIIYGSRVALLVAVLAIGAATLVGGGIGLLAGFVGGWVDEVLMRLMDILLAFPYLLLAIAIVSALGSGVERTTIAVGIWAVPNFARVVRGQVLTIKERDYVLAARALGARTPRLMLIHITPNTIAPIIVFASLYMANAILLEAALSFLGLGVQPPQSSWGLMVASGRDYLRVAPHITTFPGIAIMITVLGFNLLGDGLRDAMDPKLRNRF